VPGAPPSFDPLALLAHRCHVSSTAAGYEARCTCGWTTARPTRESRAADIDAHLTVPRTRGQHGVVSEGD
jgi:hypothetical protein